MATGGNRNVLNREIGVDGHRDWSFGLFDCTHECGLCMSSSLVNLSFNRLTYDLWRLLGALVSLRGLLKKQTASRSSTDQWHSSPRWG
jgi:hypothetical protein